jgi:hypothetical protein
MRKFFNYEEKKHDQTAMEMENCDVIEKLDGSLGIFFRYKGEWIFASRGSFVSSHAQRGMEMAKEKHLELKGKCKEEWTYLFEMIFPKNRIVVDYGDRTDLVLIAIVHTRTGDDLPLEDVITEAKRLDLTMPRMISSESTYEALQAQNINNEEGYIIRSRISGERVKLKFDDYIEIHAFRSNFSLKTVRQWFQKIDPLDRNPRLPPAKLEHVPDEKFAEAGIEWDRLAALRLEGLTRFDEAVGPCMEMEFRDVPNSPLKGWICKYLRLWRADKKSEAGLVPHQYAMSCLDHASDVPEVTSIRLDDDVE